MKGGSRFWYKKEQKEISEKGKRKRENVEKFCEIKIHLKFKSAKRGEKMFEIVGPDENFMKYPEISNLEREFFRFDYWNFLVSYS